MIHALTSTASHVNDAIFIGTDRSKDRAFIYIDLLAQT